MALDIILQHSKQQGTKEPLRMIIQGTAGQVNPTLLTPLRKHYILKQSMVTTHCCYLHQVEL